MRRHAADADVSLKEVFHSKIGRTAAPCDLHYYITRAGDPRRLNG
jgi:hypothetical protein